MRLWKYILFLNAKEILDILVEILTYVFFLMIIF